MQCVVFSDYNDDTIRLIREMELKQCQSLPIIQMYRGDSHLQTFKRRLFAITRSTICGF